MQTNFAQLLMCEHFERQVVLVSGPECCVFWFEVFSPRRCPLDEGRQTLLRNDRKDWPLWHCSSPDEMSSSPKKPVSLTCLDVYIGSPCRLVCWVFTVSSLSQLSVYSHLLLRSSFICETASKPQRLVRHLASVHPEPPYALPVRLFTPISNVLKVLKIW